MKFTNMSRIGKQPINIPSGVEVTIAGDMIKVKGPKGELEQKIHPKVKIEKNGDVITVSVANPEDKEDRSLWGLFGSLVQNMVTGVTAGFFKKLEVNGVGYKVALSGKKLVLNLGYSHPIEFEMPAGTSAEVVKNVIIVNGIDKQVVGATAAKIRSFRKPEPYKGKGIKYIDEVIRRKAGKTAAKGSE